MSEPKKVLTKADILRGTKAPEDIYFEEIGGCLTLRPITDGEYHQARAIMMAPITASAEMQDLIKRRKDAPAKDDPFKGFHINMDVGKVDTAEFEANAYIASCGLSAGKERWTPDEAKRLTPPGIVVKIAKKVYELSGVGEEVSDLVRSFRSE